MSPAQPDSLEMSGVEEGFNGMDHTANETNFNFDVSPPDHGLAVGTSSAGPIIIQSLNLSLQAFRPIGHAR